MLNHVSGVEISISTDGINKGISTFRQLTRETKIDEYYGTPVPRVYVRL